MAETASNCLSVQVPAWKIGLCSGVQGLGGGDLLPSTGAESGPDSGASDPTGPCPTGPSLEDPQAEKPGWPRGEGPGWRLSLPPLATLPSLRGTEPQFSHPWGNRGSLGEARVLTQGAGEQAGGTRPLSLQGKRCLWSSHRSEYGWAFILALPAWALPPRGGRWGLQRGQGSSSSPSRRLTPATWLQGAPVAADS